MREKKHTSHLSFSCRKNKYLAIISIAKGPSSHEWFRHRPSNLRVEIDVRHSKRDFSSFFHGSTLGSAVTVGATSVGASVFVQLLVIQVLVPLMVTLVFEQFFHRFFSLQMSATGCFSLKFIIPEQSVTK
jgi:hypothetical protein